MFGIGLFELIPLAIILLGAFAIGVTATLAVLHTTGRLSRSEKEKLEGTSGTASEERE